MSTELRKSQLIRFLRIIQKSHRSYQQGYELQTPAYVLSVYDT